MGWMFYHNPVDDVEAEIKRLSTYDSDERRNHRYRPNRLFM